MRIAVLLLLFLSGCVIRYSSSFYQRQAIIELIQDDFHETGKEQTMFKYVPASELDDTLRLKWKGGDTLIPYTVSTAVHYRTSLKQYHIHIFYQNIRQDIPYHEIICDSSFNIIEFYFSAPRIY